MAQPRAGDRKTRPTGPVAPGFRWFWTGETVSAAGSGLVRGPLVELRRVLEPGGRLLLSVNHPVIRPVVYPQEDYLATTAYIEARVGRGHRGGAQTPHTAVIPHDLT